MIIDKHGCVGIPGEYMWAVRDILDTKQYADLWGKLRSGKQMLSFWGFIKYLFEGAFDYHIEYYDLNPKDVEQLKEAIETTLKEKELTAKETIALRVVEKCFDADITPAEQWYARIE